MKIKNATLVSFELGMFICFISDDFILLDLKPIAFLFFQGDRIRKRHDWMTWLLPSPRQFNSAAGPSSPETSNYGTLVAHTQNLGLEESDTTQTEAAQLKYGD